MRDFTHHCSGKVPDLKSVHPLGSVILITDAAGAKAREMAYRPYGEVLYASAILPAILPAVSPEARGFIGERFDQIYSGGGPGCNTSTPGVMTHGWGSGGVPWVCTHPTRD